MGNVKEFPTFHYTQDLDLYCKSYGGERNSSHFRVVWVAQNKFPQIIFS
jgi:hypothetical protein